MSFIYALRYFLESGRYVLDIRRLLYMYMLYIYIHHALPQTPTDCRKLPSVSSDAAKLPYHHTEGKEKKNTFIVVSNSGCLKV